MNTIVLIPARRLPRPRPRLSRFRSGGRGAQRRSVADRGGDRARDHLPPRVGGQPARRPATEEESLALYQRYDIPASGRILWNSVLANFQPGPQDIHVDYHNDNRPPLLFISGGEDHLMPPKVQRSNAKHYKSNTITEIEEYEGMAHLLPAQKGWEEVADHALSWAVEHAGWPTGTGASTGTLKSR